MTPAPRPTIVIHDRQQAAAALRAAAAAGVAVRLLSAPGAAAYLGAAVFREMVAQAASEAPGADFVAVLDCGADPGLALNALRHGIAVVRLDAPPEVRARIADIAAQQDARLEDLDGHGDGDGPALDLLDAADPRAVARDWLSQGSAHDRRP